MENLCQKLKDHPTIKRCPLPIFIWLAAWVLLTALPQLVAAQETCNLVVPSDWSLKPQSATVGQSFRLVFITSNKRKARDTNIVGYNKFIQQDAAAGHQAIRACAQQFKALGSTSAVNARDNLNLPVTGGVPIYWLNGPKIADNYADFWDGTWDHQSNGRQADGTVISQSDVGRIWTGTRAGKGTLNIGGAPAADRGTKQQTGHLGAATPIPGLDSALRAMTGELSSNPFVTGTAGFMPVTNNYRMYGVSPLFTVGSVRSDRPAATVSLRRTSAASVYENDGTVEFTVSLSRPLASDERVDVPLILSGTDVSADDFDDLTTTGSAVLNRGVALEGADSAAPTIIFAGSGAQRATLEWVVTDDNILEEDETATITLDNLTADLDTTILLTADEHHNTFEVEIKDNEYLFCFEQTTYIVNESVGEATLKVIVGVDPQTPRPVNEDIIVEFDYLNLSTVRSEDTASLDNADYITQYTSPAYAVIPAGATKLLLNIPVIDDQKIEENDLVRVVAIPPRLPQGHLRCTADLIILDNDPTVTLSFGDVATTVLGDDIPFIVHGPNPRPTQRTVFLQSVRLRDGSIVGGNKRTLTIAPVPLATDTTVTLQVSESGDGDFISSGDEGNINVVIPKGESQMAGNISTASSDGSGEITIKLLEDQSEQDPPAYHRGRPSSLSVISSGAPLVFEQGGIRLNSAPAVVSLRRTSAATIDEYKDGKAGIIEFTVSLSRPLAADERVVVPLILSGTDVSADDFDDLTTTGSAVLNRGVALGADSAAPIIVFAGSGAQRATLEWVVTDDNILEKDETATIALGDLSSDPNTNIPLTADEDHNTFDVQIIDDEYTLCFDEDAYTVDESIGEAVLALNLSRPLNEDIIVRFSYYTPSGGAVSSLGINPNSWDFLERFAYPFYGTIKAGTTGFLLSIPVIDDRRVEGDESVSVIAIPPQLPMGHIRCLAVLTIKDNDPIVTIELGDITTTSLGDEIPFTIHGGDLRTTELTVYEESSQEEGGGISFAPRTLTIKAQPFATTFTVWLNVSESGGGDFISSDNEVTTPFLIPPGAIMATDGVPTVSGDGSGEITLKLVGSLQNPNDYFLGNPSQASVIVRNSQILPPFLRVRTRVFLEGALQ